MSSSSRKARSKSLVKRKAAMEEAVQECAPRKTCEAPVPLVDTSLSWEVPFDLQGIPTTLRKRLVLLALCLLGKHKAIYS